MVKLHLEEDRAGTLEQLRRVLNGFGMPSVGLLADSRKRVEAVKALRIFDDEVYYQEVYLPILADLGVRVPNCAAVLRHAKSCSRARTRTPGQPNLSEKQAANPEKGFA